jgi:SAM-dependent methyltransferase
MRRDRCGGCESELLEVFLDLGKTPLADRFPASADEPEPTFPLEVAVCTSCWLVQLLEVVPDAILWTDYAFHSGASPSKVAYHEQYAAWALKEFGEQARRLTVEIACNDGDLLRHFKAAGCRTVGVDPAEPVQTARRRGLDAWAVPFTRSVAKSMKAEYGPAGLVIANHVAAHVADPHDFFGGIADLLAPDGVAVVEVQYLPDLLAGNQFDHVYHEHRFFYSVGSLGRICAQHGLGILKVEHTSAQGGSIRVVLRSSGYGYESVRGAEAAEGGRLGLYDVATYKSIQARIDYLRNRLIALLATEMVDGRRLAGYGATAKSTTLLNYCGIGPGLLEYVEDTTAHKIGRVTPGTHIPIVAPGDREQPDTYLLLLWNDLAGVLRREREFLDGGGRFLVPIPVPVLL